ncbi:coiled-coil domain-containing protein 25-like [Acanthaster planci]|uniref:Coiled-coil domain-containing protein 25 n=1 Tax=Acanthaster planci TaxID=133434 RepID=A0A8B7YX02_ACAPL|nr:coiled-coil domain-containing protein 25-like [Acanthaster planci]
MVFYFKSEGYVIYVGIDKHENEELLKYGFPEDIWFHVDKHSSAHVYLRLPKGENIHTIPATVLEDCAQLVKANSITGNKTNNINVVYTPWTNLRKSADMDVGQVGFHKQKDVLSVKVEKRINEIVNRLNKTKEERMPDLQAEREERDRLEREAAKKVAREKKEKEKEAARQRQKETEIRSYSSLMVASNMKSNANADSDEDDFM